MRISGFSCCFVRLIIVVCVNVLIPVQEWDEFHYWLEQFVSYCER
jgi:hypothetical protein